MKENIKKFIKKHPVLAVGLLFMIFSVIINTVCILILGFSYCRDIVHAIPIVLFFDYVLSSILGGRLATEFILVPFIMLMDFAIGLLLGLLLNKIIKDKKKYIITLSIVFIIYWFIICFQWLPII